MRFGDGDWRRWAEVASSDDGVGSVKNKTTATKTDVRRPVDVAVSRSSASRLLSPARRRRERYIISCIQLYAK